MIHFKPMRRSLPILLLLLIALASPVRALSPKSMETDWVFEPHFSSFTSVTSKVVDVPGLGGAVSYTGGNIVGFSYAIFADGADATYTISQTTRTYSKKTGLSPAISTGTPMMALRGLPISDEFKTLTMNPVFSFSQLSASATYYLWVTTGKKKLP